VVSTLSITNVGVRRKAFRLGPKGCDWQPTQKDIKIGKQRS
jgi:hypothetical protein